MRTAQQLSPDHRSPDAEANDRLYGSGVINVVTWVSPHTCHHHAKHTQGRISTRAGDAKQLSTPAPRHSLQETMERTSSFTGSSLTILSTTSIEAGSTSPQTVWAFPHSTCCPTCARRRAQSPRPQGNPLSADMRESDVS